MAYVIVGLVALNAFAIGAAVGVERGWADGKRAFRRYCIRTYGQAWTDARYDEEGNPK